MRCSKAHELISDLLDSRLDERRGLELSHHLAACSDCRRHQELLQQGQVLLRQDLVEPPENFEWKVQLKIQQALRTQAAATEPVTGWRFWKPALASGGGVALLVLIAGGLLLQRPAATPEAGQGGQGASFLVAQPAVENVLDVDPAMPEPDLSGAVRGQPLKVNAADGGFGIRTVADEHFVKRSPFADPGQGTSHWRQERDGQALEVRRVLLPDGRVHYMLYRPARGSAGLNIGVHRSRLHGPGGDSERQQDPGS